MLLPPFPSTSTSEWLPDFQKPVVQSLLPHSVVQMALFLPSVPHSFFVPLQATMIRQEKAFVCMTSPSPMGIGSDQN